MLSKTKQKYIPSARALRGDEKSKIVAKTSKAEEETLKKTTLDFILMIIFLSCALFR